MIKKISFEELENKKSVKSELVINVPKDFKRIECVLRNYNDKLIFFFRGKDFKNYIDIFKRLRKNYFFSLYIVLKNSEDLVGDFNFNSRDIFLLKYFDNSEKLKSFLKKDFYVKVNFISRDLKIFLESIHLENLKIVNVPLCKLIDIERYLFYKIGNYTHKNSKCADCLLKDFCKFDSDEVIPIKEVRIRESFLKIIINQKIDFFKYLLKQKDAKNNVYDTFNYFLVSKNNIVMDRVKLYSYWKNFISNYDRSSSEILSLYIHFPFCESNCTYCIYNSKVYKDKLEIDNYVEFLIDNLKYFSSVFKNVSFDAFNMGGGTPSLLSPKQMDKILSTVFNLYNFKKRADISTEFNANSTTLEKLKILDKYGFKKLSIGVQSLNETVLRYANRSYQNYDIIKNFFNLFRKVNIPFLNVDLVLGLYKDRPEYFLDTLNKIIKLHPSIISVYPLKVTKDYLNKFYVSEKRFYEFYNPFFREIIKKVINISRENTLQLSYSDVNKVSYIHPFFLFDKEKSSNYFKLIKNTYSNLTVLPSSLFALGFYSNGHIYNKLNYFFMDSKITGTNSFLKNFSSNNKDYKYFVKKLLKDYEEIKFFVLTMIENFSFNLGDFENKFNKNFLVYFKNAILQLKILKIIKVKDNILYFNVKSERKLYLLLLFFLDEDVLKKNKNIN